MTSDDAERRVPAGLVRVRAREAAVIERELAAWRGYWEAQDATTQEHAFYVPDWIRRYEAIVEALDELDFGDVGDHKRIEVSWSRFDAERCRRVIEDDLTPKVFLAGWGAMTQDALDRHRIAVILWRPVVRDATTTRRVPALGQLDACVDRMWLPWLPAEPIEPVQLALDFGAAA